MESFTKKAIIEKVEAAFHEIYDEPDVSGPMPVHASLRLEKVYVRIGCDINCNPLWRWECNLPSDDDGFFHFISKNKSAIILVSYP